MENLLAGNTIVFPSDERFTHVENLETSNMEAETEEEYQLQPVTPIINTENVVSVVDQVFQLKPMETNRYTPKNKKTSGTEHRVLTSPEVLELKRKEREARDEREKRSQLKNSKLKNHKETRKIQQLSKIRNEVQEKSKPNLLMISVIMMNNIYFFLE